MTLDELVARYFETSDLSSLTKEALIEGLHKCNLALQSEKDSAVRVKLGTLLVLLRSPPSIEVIGLNQAERQQVRVNAAFLCIRLRLSSLMQTYFRTKKILDLELAEFQDGISRCRRDLDEETDQVLRLALWGFLYMLGFPPKVDEIFADPESQDAAREFAERLKFAPETYS